MTSNRKEYIERVRDALNAGYRTGEYSVRRDWLKGYLESAGVEKAVDLDTAELKTLAEKIEAQYAARP